MSSKERKKISISFKTSIVSGTIILLLFMASIFIAIQLQSNLSKLMIDQFIKTEKKSLEEESVDLKKNLINSMTVNLEICSSITKSFLYNFDQEQLGKLLASYMKLDGLVAIKVVDAGEKAFGAAWKSPDIKLGEKIPDNVELNQELSVVSDVIYEGEKIGSVRFYYTDSLMNKNIEKQEDLTQQNITSFSSIAKKNINKSVTIQIIVAILIVIALMITIVACIHVFVSKPIKNTMMMIKDIAQGEGDLTQRLNVIRNDEIGELCKWFNLFIEKLQQLIKEVMVNATDIDSSSNEFSQISTSMSAEIDGLSSRSNTVAAAAEEMSSNLSSVAASMGEASENINMVSTATEEMSSTINEIARNAENARSITDNAVSQTRNASSQVNELGEAAKQIGKVVETITDISEQVNLLALNATIEAARAGEAGKGFAVVANEIKDLANQTAEASRAIKERVQGIQASTDGTIAEISNISNIVTEINEIVSTIATAVEEQSATTREIAGNVSHASAGIQDVNENVSQGSSASRQVAQEIAEITVSTNEMASSSLEVNSNANKLSKLAAHLAELMGKFKV
ncbi:MAG: HAMP domain-containing protein [Proteobacteria bacterium]|nr:HAMP domain-containing protein [Pseudomonadota bacterium]MBU1585293.1 HAMP domain-containing protein [Pseudomonadota bacterium]MBU2452447.1 HAMP domain-containing protein [Pseudomonadota bacterium]MBU2630521.1 HAMP domain-containing protein [Pseudomonadota bacterium]